MTEFSDVFKDAPGRTNIVEHHIPTGNAKPIKLTPCRLPHTYRSEIKKEIEEMCVCVCVCARCTQGKGNGGEGPECGKFLSASIILIRKYSQIS